MTKQGSWGDLKQPVQPVAKAAPNLDLRAKIFKMENPEYSFNCFLNVVIQTLWRTQGFKDIQKILLSTSEISSPANTTDHVVNALIRLFS